MKVKFNKDTLTLQAETEQDRHKLEFLMEVHKKNALPNLIDTFADLINKDILRIHRGKLIWNSEWEIIANEIPGYQ